MRLTVTTVPWQIDDNFVEIRVSYNNEKNIVESRELLQKELCADKMLTRRMIDKMFYEMKLRIFELYSIT